MKVGRAGNLYTTGPGGPAKSRPGRRRRPFISRRRRASIASDWTSRPSSESSRQNIAAVDGCERRAVVARLTQCGASFSRARCCGTGNRPRRRRRRHTDLSRSDPKQTTGLWLRQHGDVCELYRDPRRELRSCTPQSLRPPQRPLPPHDDRRTRSHGLNVFRDPCDRRPGDVRDMTNARMRGDRSSLQQPHHRRCGS